MAISVELVEYLLLDNLRYFHTSGSPVTKDILFSDALSSSRVAGSTPRTLFKNVTRHDIVMNGGTDKAWPDDWLNKSISTLAPDLV